MNKLLLLLVLVALAVGGYFFINPDRTQDLLEGTPLESENGAIRVYKWQDSQGRWQVTDEPPPQGIAYELKEYSPEVIPLPLPPAPPPE
jgi:hypothetical protein